MQETTSPLSVLKKYFGFESFRSGQFEIISSILARRNTLAVLATGGGKSVCFQVPGLMLPGTTLVISPLISLMKDQVDALASRGIAATYINSSLSHPERKKRLSLAQAGHYTFLYISPERLATQSFKEFIFTAPIPLVVIDEAHCISEWGHDFRPTYRYISHNLRGIKNKPVFVALTATATNLVKKDIITNLQLTNCAVITEPSTRKNLHIYTYHCLGNTAQELALFRVLKKHRGESGIIYTATRQKTSDLVARISQLQAHNTAFSTDDKVLAYHGGLDSLERDAVQQSFIHNKIKVVVATNAFGMGIDKKNIRFVIHYHLPASLEQYSQEIGRAGRDRKQASAYLLFNPDNLAIHHALIAKETQNHRRKIKLKNLQQMQQYCQSTTCKQVLLSNHFGEVLDPCRTHCTSCATAPQTHHLLVGISERVEEESVKKLLTAREELASQYKLTTTEVFSDKILCQLALYLPKNTAACQLISGIGDGWIAQWWNKVKQIPI